MATSQHFVFNQPDRDGITTLHIEEAPTAVGSWTEIDSTTDVGEFPEYITEFTTNMAIDATDWFRIRWSDGKGAFTAFSEPLKGVSTTLVGEVVKRARQRNRSMDFNVLTQEAESAIQWYLGEDVDPYDPTLMLSYRKLNGLTYLTMANAMIATDLGGSQAISSGSIGLVQFKTQQSSKSSANEIKALIDLANTALSIATSYVLQMEYIGRRRVYNNTSDFRSIGCGVVEA